eukprot:scaffold12504_cov88-Isochrysis_galbana.AAC.2
MLTGPSEAQKLQLVLRNCVQKSLELILLDRVVPLTTSMRRGAPNHWVREVPEDDDGSIGFSWDAGHASISTGQASTSSLRGEEAPLLGTLPPTPAATASPRPKHAGRPPPRPPPPTPPSSILSRMRLAWCAISSTGGGSRSRSRSRSTSSSHPRSRTSSGKRLACR